MRVLIDGRPVLRGRGGIPRYTLSAIESLSASNSGLDYAVFSWSKEATLIQDLTELPVVSSAIPGRILLRAARRRWPGAPSTGLHHPRVFHGTDFETLRFMGAAAITTIYDVAFIRVPHCYPPGAADRFHATVRHSVKTADLLLTISEHARADLIETYRLDPDRVSVVYPAVLSAGHRLGAHDHCDTATQLTGSVHRPFLLHVGVLDARKNLENLLLAFNSVSRSEELDLVLAGPDGSDPTYASKLRTAVRDMALGKRVHFLGAVSQANIRWLYGNCLAVTVIGIYEGFGLPAVEAMLYGKPLIAARAAALPEIVEDAALLVDPLDFQDIANGITRVLHDHELRVNLRLAANRRVSAFSQEQMAASLEAIYRRFE